VSDGTLSAEMGSVERERLFEAILVELGERGYEGVSLERALARCGISDEELGADLAGKDACLFAAYDELTGRLIGHATAACDAEAEWPERIRAGLQRVLEELAAQPEMARAMARSFPAIRPAAYRRHLAFLEAFTPFLREGREFPQTAPQLPAEVEMLAVGAAETIVVEEIDAGRAKQLPSMLPSILFSLLVPFLGPDAAWAAMLSAQARL